MVLLVGMVCDECVGVAVLVLDFGVAPAVSGEYVCAFVGPGRWCVVLVAVTTSLDGHRLSHLAIDEWRFRPEGCGQQRVATCICRWGEDD